MKTYIRDDGCIESGWFVPAGCRRIDLGAYPASTLLRLSASAPDFPGTVLRFDIVTGAHFRHVDNVSVFEEEAREWAPRVRRLVAMSDLRAIDCGAPDPKRHGRNGICYSPGQHHA